MKEKKNGSKFAGRKVQKYYKPVNGYVVLKFYEIEQIPLISLRNMEDSGHCEASFMYFYSILSENTPESLDDGSIDLELYESICKDIKGKFFITVGYTTDLDVEKIKAEKEDCEHLLYFWSTDVAWSFFQYHTVNNKSNPMVVTQQYLEQETAAFLRQSVPPF